MIVSPNYLACIADDLTWGSFLQHMPLTMGLVFVPGVNGVVDDLMWDFWHAFAVLMNSNNDKTAVHGCHSTVPLKITIAPAREARLNTGQTYNLTCNAAGDPHPSITWTKDGVPANQFNVPGYLLQLVNVQRKDAGSYKCTASNGYGDDATSVSIVGIECNSSDCEAKKVAIRLQSEDWKPAHSNQTSPEYRILESKLLSAIWSVYTKNPDKQLYRVDVDNFRSGSVVATVELFFGNSATNPLKPLQDEINGKLGPFTVDQELVLNPTILPRTSSNTSTFTSNYMFHSTTTASTSISTGPGNNTSLRCHRQNNKNIQDREIPLQVTTSSTNASDNLMLRADASAATLHSPQPEDSFSGKNQVNLDQEYMSLNPATKLRNWEMSREHVHVVKIIGKGAFSQVAKAMAQNVNGVKGLTIVAVKMLKDPLLVLIEYIPYGDLLGYLKKSRGLNDTYFKDPDVKPQTNLTSQQLMRFCQQIADGMSYLCSSKIIHRDLAARNVLVGEGEKCKVTDFVMARNVYQDDTYTKESRITVIQSEVSSKLPSPSDWILTAGGSPYPGINPRVIANKLQKGYRMPKPKHVDDQLYQIMLQCWQENPNDRPTFSKLKDTITRMAQNALADHDSNVLSLQDRARKGKLEAEQEEAEVKVRPSPLHGTSVYARRTHTRPPKMEAIVNMPRADDKRAVQRLLGCVIYLSRFMPTLSENQQSNSAQLQMLHCKVS
ncbi:hypothetical protein ACROYT_G028402 [Oculina patagonica]